MSKHYDVLADNFDESWLFSEEYREWYTEQIIEALDIKSNDVMIDVGCGTGVFTKNIIEKSLLSNAICIENSPNMCNISNKYKILDVICSDAVEYFHNNKTSFNKVLFKEVLHHIVDRKLLFSSIYHYLDKHGKVLIITRPKRVEFPFFEAAHQSFSQSQPDYNIFVEELRNCGLKFEVNICKYSIRLSSERWHEMLRNKFMSSLAEFTDIEIKQGILELIKNDNKDEYVFDDNLIFILASK